MITDVFLRRYPQTIFWGDEVRPEIHRLFMQVTHIVFSDLASKLMLDQGFFGSVHDGLARELGVGRLFDAQEHDAMCGHFLTEQHDIWNDRHGMPDDFIKARLSLIELLFRAFEARADPADVQGRASVAQAIRELNDRFRQARVGLHFHNGLLQFSHDQLTETTNAEPCWDLLRDEKWRNVDRDLKEALHRADSGSGDAAFHAAKALESTVKIISDEQGWTTGSEKGAANYVDNLISQKNGRFIAIWEGDFLKSFFLHVRNPHGHGSGSQPPPTLADYQTAWAIETAMSWIKSLIRRL